MKSLAVVLAVLAASPVMAATCTDTESWGSLGPPGSHGLGNTFTTRGSFLDCYTFSLTSAASSFGFVFEIDPARNQNDIDITSVSFYSGGVSNTMQTGSELGGTFDVSFGAATRFGFGPIGAGTYTLAVASNVFKDRDLNDRNNNPVSYSGSIFTSSASVSSAAPEPASYAMMLAGLAGVVAAARRRKSN